MQTNYDEDAATAAIDLLPMEAAYMTDTTLGTPEVEDCASDIIPQDAQAESGAKKLLVPELVSMWKYLLNKEYGDQRLTLFSFLNRILRSGELSHFVGFAVPNRTINKQVCSFTNVDFWKYDRYSFWANVALVFSSTWFKYSVTFLRLVAQVFVSKSGSNIR